MGDLGGGGQTVDGDADGENVRPVSGLTEETQEGVHLVEGEEEELVPSLDLLNDAGLLVQVLRPAGLVGDEGQRIRHIRRQGTDEVVDVLHIQGRLVDVDLVLPHLDAVFEKL